MSEAQTIGLIYCGFSVICAFLLLFSAVITVKLYSRYSIAHYMFLTYLCCGIASVFDCAYPLRELHILTFSPFWSYCLTLIYVVTSTLTGVFWIVYSEKKQNSFFLKSKKIFIAYLVPLIASLFIAVSSPLTHWYFYIEDGHYVRGKLFVAVSSLLFVYVVQSGVTALIRSFRKENYVERNEFKRLFAFSFVYLLIQVVQLVLPNVFPYRTVGLMLIFEILLMQNMKETIGIDALTHINNRYALDRYLGTVVSSGEGFEIAMLDVDKFKSINDKFGHVEGDKALRCVADALKNVAPKNSFFARYGGDEFLIVNTDSKVSISGMENKINQNIASLLHSQKSKFEITVSAGVLNFSGLRKDQNIKSIPDLLEAVDARLYRRKQEKNEK